MSSEDAGPARTETSLDDNIMPPIFSVGDSGNVAACNLASRPNISDPQCGFTFAEKTSSIAKFRLQPVIVSICRRLSVQIG